jgi:hypothetical protein
MKVSVSSLGGAGSAVKIETARSIENAGKVIVNASSASALAVAQPLHRQQPA